MALGGSMAQRNEGMAPRHATNAYAEHCNNTHIVMIFGMMINNTTVIRMTQNWKAAGILWFLHN